MSATHEKLPPDRAGITHRFRIADLKGYVTVNCYADGRPAEVFLVVHRVGGLERGMSHALAVMISVALQHGVPLAKITGKLKGMTFEPQGLTASKAIPMARSLADYLGRWLEMKFLPAAPMGESDEIQAGGSPPGATTSGRAGLAPPAGIPGPPGIGAGAEAADGGQVPV